MRQSTSHDNRPGTNTPRDGPTDESFTPDSFLAGEDYSSHHPQVQPSQGIAPMTHFAGLHRDFLAPVHLSDDLLSLQMQSLQLDRWLCNPGTGAINVPGLDAYGVLPANHNLDMEPYFPPYDGKGDEELDLLLNMYSGSEFGGPYANPPISLEESIFDERNCLTGADLQYNHPVDGYPLPGRSEYTYPPGNGVSQAASHHAADENLADNRRNAAPSNQLSTMDEIFHTIDEQKRLFRNAENLPSIYTGPIVPQKIYTPPTENDVIRYVRKAKLLPPVYFWEGPNCGIPVIDILAHKMDNLQDPDEPVLARAGQCISVRIKWPGYRNWTKQAAAMDFRRIRTPIPRKKVAHLIAKKISYFFKDVEDGKLPKKLNSDSREAHHGSRWEIGPKHIRLDDVVLVSLHNVSQGSWQPQLRLRSS